MEDYALPFWIYMGVMSVFVGGAIKRVFSSNISAFPTLVAWLSATVLVERLWSFCVPVVLVLAGLCLACYLYSARGRTPPPLPAEGKAVFITGCDTGFGNAAARKLDELGFEVFATVLNLSGEGARDLQRTCSPRLTLLQVDITQPQQVQQALLDTKAKLGVRGLWGLVNNAGVCVNFGDAELSLMSDFRGCMEVNFFGTLTVTKTFLPLVRQAKGRIITISSPAGDQPFPCLAAYGASKAALNLFINTLRHEMEPWGVKVSTILPSSYKTGQSSNHEYWECQFKHMIQNLSPSLLEDYGEDYMEETKDLFHTYAKTASKNLSPVISTITEALLSPRPHISYYAGPGVGLMYFIFSYFPVSISDKFLQKLFVQKKLTPLALRKENGLSLKHTINNNNNNNVEKLDK